MDMNPIKDMRLQACCVKEIERINTVITSHNILSCVLVALPVFKAFFYPPGASQLASLTSTVVSITMENWMVFAKDIQSLKGIAAVSIYKIAGEHAMVHTMRNDRKLQQFWEGVADAFMQAS